jgi:predicted nucleic acid-binding protein
LCPKPVIIFGGYVFVPNFLDTNVLLYSVGDAPADAKKREVALQLLRHRDSVVSIQVLQEFFHQATRPSRRDRMTADIAIGFVESWHRFEIVENTAEILAVGMALSRDHRLSIWDALIVAAAQQSGCEKLLTEDLSHGQRFGSLRVENPFL